VGSGKYSLVHSQGLISIPATLLVLLLLLLLLLLLWLLREVTSAARGLG